MIAPRYVKAPLQWNRVRPTGDVIDGALVHSMAEYVRNDFERWGPVGVFPAAVWLDKKMLSAHCLISSEGYAEGGTILELVSFHAGGSEWQARRELNDSFLGAEWLVAGEHGYGSWRDRIEDPEVYTSEQYNAGGWLYATWLAQCPHMSIDRILGHSQVAGGDVRGAGKGKRDPGPGFDWERFRESVHAWEGELDL